VGFGIVDARDVGLHPRVHHIDEVPRRIKRNGHRTNDHQPGEEVVAQTRAQMRWLGCRLERKLGEPGLEVIGGVLRELSKIGLEIVGFALALARPRRAWLLLHPDGSRLIGLAADPAHASKGQNAGARLGASRSIVIRDGLEARSPKGKGLALRPAGGARKGTLDPARSCNSWVFAALEPGLGGDQEAIDARALELGAGSLALLSTGEWANAHTIERPHVAPHGLVDLRLTRPQRVGVFALDARRKGLRLGLGPRHPELDAEATFGFGPRRALSGRTRTPSH